MLPIFNTKQIHELDACTIERRSISSIDLMESACRAFVQWFVEKYEGSRRVVIVCGAGNNGGDGLGVARLLSEWNYPVSVWLVKGGVKESDDFRTNYGRLPSKVKVFSFEAISKTVSFDCDILIDALFGSGLSRPAEGVYADAITAMNQTNAVRIAVDVPSGLFADKHSSGAIVRADTTVTFQLPKVAFLLPENAPFVGRWHLVDIGLDKTFIKDTATPYKFLTRQGVKKILHRRGTFDHKGTNGKALLVSGSFGKMGACVLGASAAIRAGVGLLTVHVPNSGNTIIQSSVPEAMASVDDDEKIFTVAPAVDQYDAIGIGPGLGQAEKTVAALRKVLEAGKPMVIDADALNILGANRELMLVIPRGSILTPHPKEFERLTGPWQHDFERLENQLKLAKDLKSVVVLKGAYSSIATPDGSVYFNATGNPGMATGGSGDVLTGILTGLLAQKYSAQDAAVLGVYLHGMAGDIAARERSMNSLIASDIVSFLPMAFREL